MLGSCQKDVKVRHDNQSKPFAIHCITNNNSQFCLSTTYQWKLISNNPESSKRAYGKPRTCPIMKSEKVQSCRIHREEGGSGVLQQ